jgi:tRNA threonylcarbamoyladenosine dehydratase
MNSLETDFFSRTALVVGDEGVEKFKNASVTVAGIGGVGSYAAEALARAGVGSITLIDSDTIHASNINRQIHALSTNVGFSKVAVMADRLSLVNPALEINVIQMTITPENVSDILPTQPAVMLDAIDSFSAKVALLSACHSSGITVISSMGAAGRLDPSRVKVGDISVSQGCRLARKLRKVLRQAGIGKGITVVYSDEPFESGFAVNTCDGNDFRRPLGSISYMPAIFGMTMAAVAIRTILGLK